MKNKKKITPLASTGISSDLTPMFPLVQTDFQAPLQVFLQNGGTTEVALNLG